MADPSNDLPAMSLHPDFPVVTGEYAMRKDWLVSLPAQFNRRIEDGSLVLWMPELTFWINVWSNDAGLSMDEQLVRIRAGAGGSDEQLERGDALVRLTYELADEESEHAPAQCSAISGHVIAPSGYVQISAHYDTPEARSLGYQIIHSIRPT
jgi:hypothetical protein